MRHEPTAENLLETARGVLRDRILPALPPDLRYDALMIANAIAIAARQIAAGDRPVVEAEARLRALCDAPGEGAAALDARLVAELRAGAFDAPGPRRDALYDHLLATARARAAESNPKALG